MLTFFIRDKRIYICHSVGPFLHPSLCQKRHRSYYKNKDEDDEEEVKNDKDDKEDAEEDDKEEDEENYQTIKCLTFFIITAILEVFSGTYSVPPWGSTLSKSAK